MLRNLLPKNTDFFNYFEELSALLIQANRVFLELSREDGAKTAQIAKIKALEHDADTVTHRCMEELHKTFITPIDRYEIHSLIKRMDDILDSVDATASRIALYEIGAMRPEAAELALLLCQAAEELDSAVKGIRNLKNAEAVNRHCIKLHEIETAGDSVLRLALGRLFKEEKDCIHVMKWKEIYERLEKAIDRCDDVANIIEGIVIEAT